ncbi:MAG: hypothetical protein MUF87_14905 [Anaerolineae bacterium]|jgi:hypothetical protein|nr:hypothetical protein [Anaerolineae bacterium]
MASRTIVKRQLRGFVVFWTTLTLIIAAATFFAIYLTYDNLIGAGDSISVPLPTRTAARQIAAEVTVPPTRAVGNPTATVVTVAPPPSQTPAVNTAAIASAPTENVPPTWTPTVNPIEYEGFEAGIQVQYSLDLDEENMDGYLRDVSQRMGLGWFKYQVRWEDIELARDQHRWRVPAFVFNSARKFNLKVMISVVTAPAWAREPGVDLTEHGPPADNADYVDFVTTLIRRYPTDIHAIEVWNEQNLDREWTSTEGLSAANYVSLLRDTYQAVKAINPNIIIISGALAPTGFDDGIGAINDQRYMEQMIAAGLLNYTDCVGAHHNGYNIGPSVTWDQVPPDPTATFRGPFDNDHPSWSFRSTLEGYHNQIRLAGGDQKLCVTEFGWPSTEDLEGQVVQGFEFANDNSLDEQATWTIEALNNMESWGFVRLAFLWNYNYGPQAGWDAGNDNVAYSIIGPDWVHRPVYDALIQWQQGRLNRP